MKLLAMICLMAVGASALYGHSGMIMPDGTPVQFTREQADNIGSIGASGVVMLDGKNFQMSADFAAQHGNLPPPPSPVVHALGGHPRGKRQARWKQPVVGEGGMITPNGQQIQFPHGVSVLLAGSSAVILTNGDTVQYQ